MYLKNKIIYLFFVLCCSSVFAQYNTSANDNSNVKWREIETEKFSLVYLSSFENRAKYISSVVDTLFSHISTTSGISSPKIPILIHPFSAKSNGMATWSPKRLELYPTPSPTYYAYPFDIHLCIHESRHAAQFYSQYKGITKTLTNIFGQHILTLVNMLIIPNWFIEGDAVMTETAFAQSGRGQNPEFKNEEKALLLEKGTPNFFKAKLGSRKDFIPDKYVFGYYLTAYSRSVYGKDIHADVLTSTANSWHKLRWFNRADSMNLRYKPRRIYYNMTDSLVSYWTQENNAWLKKENKSKLDTIPLNKKYYTNFRNPIQRGKDTILALKTNYFEVQKLVQYTENGLETIGRFPYLMHSYFDYKDNKILYSQNSLGPRWEQETYADIIEYDLDKKKASKLTKNAVFFTPSYNPNNSKEIAAIETSNENGQCLVVLCFNDEKDYEIKRFKSKCVDAVSYPTWSEDSKYIYVIETSTQGKAVVRYSLENKEKETIIPPSFDNISQLKLRNNSLYFIKDLEGKYELVEYDLNQRKAQQISETQFGIGGYALCDNEDLVLAPYNSDGYFLSFSKKTPIEIDIERKNPSQVFVEEIKRQENFLLPINLDTAKFESKKYSKVKNLFDFHSWSPFFLNLTKKNFGLGVSAYSQNLLSTSVLQAGYKFNVNETKHETYLTYTYSGFYPIFDFETAYKLRNTSEKTLENELYSALQMRVPYSWSGKQTVSKVQANLSYAISQLPQHKSNLYNIVGYGVDFTHQYAKVHNDISLTKAINFNFSRYTTLDEAKTNVTSFSAKTYLPFFLKNSSTEFNFSWQHNVRKEGAYPFANQIDFIKGVKNEFPTSYYGGGVAVAFPIAYPDWILGPVLYIQRLSLKPFYEIGSFDQEVYYSFGNDFGFNINILAIALPIEIGLRVGYETLNQKPFFQFLLSM